MTAPNPLKQVKTRNRIVNSLSTIINSIGFIKEKDAEYTFSDHISYLLRAFENADPKTKSKIENHLVKIGKDAASILVKSLVETKGTTRGLIAMTLIRIGTPVISHLEQIVFENPDLNWVVDYITTEIKGSQIALTNPSLILEEFNAGQRNFR